jgi:hypothetical protein
MRLLHTSFLLFAGFILCTSTLSAQWKQSMGFNSHDHISGFVASGSYLFADANTIGGATIDSLYASADNGLTWAAFAPNGGAPIIAYGTSGFVGTASYPIPGGLQGILSYSTNNGQTWSPDTLGWMGQNGLASVLITASGKIFGASGTTGLYQQTAPGEKWTPDTVGLSSGGTPYPIVCMTTFKGMIYVGSYGVFVSSNSGASWTTADNGLPPQSGLMSAVSAFAQSGTMLYAMLPHNGLYDSLYDFYRTTDGLNWTHMNKDPQDVGFGIIPFVANANSLFTTGDKGVFVSNDNGVTWTLMNQGFPTFDVSGSFIDQAIISGGNLVVGREILGEIWYRKLSDFGSASVNGAADAPSFMLSESYPNPVSSTSKINYSLPHDGISSLTLFDITGRQIKVLVNGYQTAGDHSATFDGSALPAGIYFYRLNTENGSIGSWLQLIK